MRGKNAQQIHTVIYTKNICHWYCPLQSVIVSTVSNERLALALRLVTATLLIFIVSTAPCMCIRCASSPQAVSVFSVISLPGFWRFRLRRSFVPVILLSTLTRAVIPFSITSLTLLCLYYLSYHSIYNIKDRLRAADLVTGCPRIRNVTSLERSIDTAYVLGLSFERTSSGDDIVRMPLTGGFSGCETR